MQKGDLIFVYGTLRTGESNDISNWRAPAGSGGPAVEEFGSDAIDGVMYDCGWYPGVQKADDFGSGGEVIFGEVFQIVGNGVVDRLDMYEGYPSLYDRVQVTSMRGRKVWVYTYNDEMPESAKVDGGDWVNYMSLKRAELRAATARIDVC